MEKVLNIAFCGLGGRGEGHLEYFLKYQKDVNIAGVCDLYQDRREHGVELVRQYRGEDQNPLCGEDYHELLKIKDLDAIVISTSWEDHIPISIAAMKAGVRPGVEVGGAYSMDQLWQLVHTYEETRVPCMLLENCCYGREELMLIRMVREGLFGDLVHLEGGYHHDLRQEITEGRENRHYRLHNYMHRNCENYPTHELGPIAQMLNINHGNRMVMLNSVASCSRGLNAYLKEQKGRNFDLADYPFAQGDVVTTIIKCAGGETITLSLDTNTPKA